MVPKSSEGGQEEFDLRWNGGAASLYSLLFVIYITRHKKRIPISENPLIRLVVFVVTFGRPSYWLRLSTQHHPLLLSSLRRSIYSSRVYHIHHTCYSIHNSQSDECRRCQIAYSSITSYHLGSSVVHIEVASKKNSSSALSPSPTAPLSR